MGWEEQGRVVRQGSGEALATEELNLMPAPFWEVSEQRGHLRLGLSLSPREGACPPSRLGGPGPVAGTLRARWQAKGQGPGAVASGRQSSAVIELWGSLWWLSQAGRLLSMGKWADRFQTAGDGCSLLPGGLKNTHHLWIPLQPLDPERTGGTQGCQNPSSPLPLHWSCPHSRDMEGEGGRQGPPTLPSPACQRLHFPEPWGPPP